MPSLRSSARSSTRTASAAESGAGPLLPDVGGHVGAGTPSRGRDRGEQHTHTSPGVDPLGRAAGRLRDVSDRIGNTENFRKSSSRFVVRPHFP